MADETPSGGFFGDPSVDAESSRNLATLTFRVTDRFLETGLQAIAEQAGLATASSDTSDFVVSDYVTDHEGPQTILLIEHTPAHARAALDALAEGLICSILPLADVAQLPEVVSAAMHEFALVPQDVRHLAGMAPTLTERHRQILDRLSMGLTNEQIAARECVGGNRQARPRADVQHVRKQQSNRARFPS